MALFRVDTLIKELRKSRNLTQEELCEGICTKDSLSRIERGLRRPDWHTFKLIMEKLGEDPRKYYTDIVTVNDKRILDLRDRLKHLLRDKNNTEAEALIIILEQDNDFKEKTNRQFLLMARATLAGYNKDYNQAYNYAIEALRITKPNFSEEKIDSYILFNDEITLINQIAVVHSFVSSLEKSTDVLLKLKISLEKNYIDDDEKLKLYIGLLYNITKNLGLLKRYDECIPICDNGIELCKKYRNAFHHPMFLFNKACCLLYLNEREEGVNLLGRVYSLLIGNERLTELSYIETYVESEFGIKIPSIKSTNHSQE